MPPPEESSLAKRCLGQLEISPDPGYLLSDDDRSRARRGMFYRNGVVRISEVTDGTSNTLFVDERSRNTGRQRFRGR